MRVDPVLVAASCAVLGSLFIACPGAAVAAVAGILLVLGRRLPRRARIAAALVFALGAVRAARKVPAFESELESTRAALGPPSRCAGLAEVETQPALRAGALGFVARFESLDCEGRRLAGARVRLHGGPPDLARGDRVEVVAQLASVELFRNAELPDPAPAAARPGATLSGGTLAVRFVRRSSGLAALVDRARARVRARIEATFAPEAAPMARALVLGENDLSGDDDAAFRASGLAHLLAVSGTHLVVAVLGVVGALRFVLARIERLARVRDVGRYAASVGVLLAPLYADFAGGSGSAWRAAWMLSAGLGARALGRHPSPTRSFALSLAAGAVLDPLVGFDVSFGLSAAATAGLIAFGAPLVTRFSPAGSHRLRRLFVSASVPTLAAMLPCAPLLARLGPTITLAGMLANVVAVPFGEVISLPLCLSHAVLPFGPLERGIALVASGALLVVRAIARVSASTTWLALPVPPPSAWQLVLIGLGGLGAVVRRARYPGARAVRGAFPLAAALGVAAVEWAAVRAGRPEGVLRVSVLDVGQGDATLIDLPDGEIALIDGGGFVGSPVDPGVSVITPLLRVRRRSRIDVAVLSHPHPDHYIGLASALRTVAVGELWDTGQGRAQGAGPEYENLIASLERRRVPIRGPAELCGPERTIGGARVAVLAPCPSFDPVLGPNDNSFVVRIRFGERGALFMGDAEHEEEARLVATRPDLRADLLKVGHHGSRTSTGTELLSLAKPALATISCGVRNRFGHPHAATLSALEEARIPAFRTDRVGSIEWQSDGRVRVFGEHALAGFW